jgi:parallel beta-helix repeat protein
MGGAGPPPVYDAHTGIYNNTVTDNKWDGIFVHSANYVTVKNNIITGNSSTGGKAQLRFETYVGHDVDNNLYGSTGDVIYWNLQAIPLSLFQVLGFEPRGLIGAVSFADPSARDYRLTAGSAAYNRGAALADDGVSTDIEGRPRPQGAAFDMGAYELPGNEPAPPLAPTGLRLTAY